MITGRLAQIHFSTIRRCVLGITSAGSSTPRSPRATMMPYEASMISSMLSSPSWFSIFEMILMLLPWASRISCTARMSRAERTNECAMKSTSFFTAHSMKRRSFSVTDGAVQLRIVLAHDADFQLAVGDQHPRPDGNVAHDRRHVHVDHLAGREVRAVRTAHGHPVPRAEIDAVAVFVGDRRDADFGSFGIYHNRNGRVHPVHRLDDMRGPVLGDVRRIDAHHVHTRVEKLFYELFGAAEIRHRSDNLGFFHAIHRAMFLRLYYPSIRSRAVLPPPLASFTSLSTPNPSPERT